MLVHFSLGFFSLLQQSFLKCPHFVGCNMARFNVQALYIINNNRTTGITTYNNTNNTTPKCQTMQSEANRMIYDCTKIHRAYF